MANNGIAIAVEHQPLCRRSTNWAIADIHRVFIFAVVAQAHPGYPILYARVMSLFSEVHQSFTPFG